MNPATQAALEESIAHWKRFADGTEDVSERPYSDDCALCNLFLANHCKGCPVSERTGKTDCEGSPWIVASDSYDEWKGGRADESEFRFDAGEMLAFLESLRPESSTEPAEAEGQRSVAQVSSELGKGKV